MSSLAEKLKASKPRELIVEVDGDKYLVRGLSRVAKSKLYNQAVSPAGKWDAATYEGLMLAACVRDPETEELLLPDPADWDIPAELSGPLVEACADLIGLSKSEKDAVKNSEPTES